MRIHHVGYLVKNQSAALEAFKILGFQVVSSTTHDLHRGIEICFIEKDGYRIELVSPWGENSIINILLKRHRNSPYHICYASEQFEQDLAEISSKGFLQIDEPLEAPALAGQRVVFLLSPVLGMIELLDEPRTY